MLKPTIFFSSFSLSPSTLSALSFGFATFVKVLHEIKHIIVIVSIVSSAQSSRISEVCVIQEDLNSVLDVAKELQIMSVNKKL